MDVTPKKRLVVASGNAHKLREIAEIFTDFEVVSQKQMGFDEDVEETGSIFMENALNQDQAYELAASLGESINLLIEEDKLDINGITLSECKTDPDTGVDTYYRTIYSQTDFEGLPDSSVTAIVTESPDGSVRILTVTADVGKAEYIYEREYRQ